MVPSTSWLSGYSVGWSVVLSFKRLLRPSINMKLIVLPVFRPSVIRSSAVFCLSVFLAVRLIGQLFHSEVGRLVNSRWLVIRPSKDSQTAQSNAGVLGFSQTFYCVLLQHLFRNFDSFPIFQPRLYIWHPESQIGLIYAEKRPLKVVLARCGTRRGQ
jgi:hypothetical protein